MIERLCEVLLCRHIPFHDKQSGEIKADGPLLEKVQDRYTEEGRLQAFEQIIGDGTLWLVLSSAISRSGDHGLSNFRRNLILRDIVRSPALMSTAIPEHLKPLAKQLGHNVNQPDFLNHLESLHSTFTELEAYLTEHFERFQALRCPKPKAGDWLWKPGVGYAVIEKVHTPEWARVHIRERASTPDRVKLEIYANLRWLKERDATLANLMRDLLV